MEKLVKKFKGILEKGLISNYDDGNITDGGISGGDETIIVCAEEAKRVAIEFANYCNSSGDCSEMFDNFINSLSLNNDSSKASTKSDFANVISSTLFLGITLSYCGYVPKGTPSISKSPPT